MLLTYIVCFLLQNVVIFWPIIGTKNTSFWSWFGVTCSSKRQRVVACALPNLQLQGTISPFFVSGIPYGLGHFPRLQVIDIQNNQLQGRIPISLFQHQRFQVISSPFNRLCGEMWRRSWYVPELRVTIASQRIKGQTPKDIGNVSHVAFLYLTDNQLS
ncbi:hypothetical protein H5410_050345, partial [Solanum commersonii]